MCIVLDSALHYDTMVQPLLKDHEPCYILYRLDSMQGDSYEWLLLAHTPELSVVKDKMIYAATRSTLKMEFGGGKIKEEIYGILKEDLSLEAYKHHKAAADGPAPLTVREQELRTLAEADIQARTEIGTQTRHSHLHGVSFPIKEDAMDQLLKLKNKEIMYVQLSINIDNEEILLANQRREITISDLPGLVPDDHPRYHLFLYKHTYEGDYLEQIVFIYSCPGYKCSVKERMLYSSCKAAVTGIVESDLQMEIVKKIEISEGSELTADFILDEVHPKLIVHKPQFMRPPPPQGRRRSKSPKPVGENGEDASNGAS